jgi:hypothetical protein
MLIMIGARPCCRASAITRVSPQIHHDDLHSNVINIITIKINMTCQFQDCRNCISKLVVQY